MADESIESLVANWSLDGTAASIVSGLSRLGSGDRLSDSKRVAI